MSCMPLYCSFDMQKAFIPDLHPSIWWPDICIWCPFPKTLAPKTSLQGSLWPSSKIFGLTHCITALWKVRYMCYARLEAKLTSCCAPTLSHLGKSIDIGPFHFFRSWICPRPKVPISASKKRWRKHWRCVGWHCLSEQIWSRQISVRTI